VSEVPSLAVEVAGSHAVRLGPLCEIPDNRTIRLWIPTKEGADLRLFVGSRALVPTGTPGHGVLMSMTSGTPTICPGTYYGGIAIGGSASVTMMPGVYYMAGGFRVFGSGAVDGSSGVMIYNSSGTITEADTAFGVDLVPEKDKSKKNAKNVQLTATPNKNIDPFESVVLSMQVGRDKIMRHEAELTAYAPAHPARGGLEDDLEFGGFLRKLGGTSSYDGLKEMISRTYRAIELHEKQPIPLDEIDAVAHLVERLSALRN